MAHQGAVGSRMVHMHSVLKQLWDSWSVHPHHDHRMCCGINRDGSFKSTALLALQGVFKQSQWCSSRATCRPSLDPLLPSPPPPAATPAPPPLRPQS